VVAALLALALPAQARTFLASWVDGPDKARVVEFVQQVTDPTSRTYVSPAERIAVFDNDGTLWCEQPVYVQVAFVIDRVKALAPQHPEWRTTEPFKSVLAGDLRGVAASGERGLLELVTATHAGMTTDEFRRIVAEWLATARHPRFGRPYTELAYAPMLELLTYLRANGFKTYIVSGGDVEFMRVFAERVYGVPPEQVVGSNLATQYEVRNGDPVIMRLPKLEFLDDKSGKPVGIDRYIGRRPILAFGNSDGDLQMLEYTTGAPGPRLALLVHHDDGEREYAYDRTSSMGRLDQALDVAAQRGWVVVNVKSDWSRVFPDPVR
jgi:phosphoserine phosphatase